MPIIVWAVIAVSALGLLAGIGYKIREGGYDACKVEWSAASESQRQKELQASALAAKELEEERQKKKVVIQTRTAYVNREVEKPVYRNVCLPDTGLSCLNAAIAGKDATGCKPDSTVPPVKPAG